MSCRLAPSFALRAADQLLVLPCPHPCQIFKGLLGNATYTDNVTEMRQMITISLLEDLEGRVDWDAILMFFSTGWGAASLSSSEGYSCLIISVAPAGLSLADLWLSWTGQSRYGYNTPDVESLGQSRGKGDHPCTGAGGYCSSGTGPCTFPYWNSWGSPPSNSAACPGVTKWQHSLMGCQLFLLFFFHLQTCWRSTLSILLGHWWHFPLHSYTCSSHWTNR